MDYWDSAQFYPHYSNEDKVRMYAAFGGVPYFNAQIDDRISPKKISSASLAANSRA